MRKMYILFIIQIFFLNNLNLHSQNYIIENLSIDRIYSIKEMDKLNKRICFLMKEKGYYPDDRRVVLHHISRYSLLSSKWGIAGRFTKDDFLDGSFLSRLIPQNINDRIVIDSGRYIGSTVLVEDINGDYVGKGDAEYFYLAARYNPEFFAFLRFILEKKKELSIIQLFTLDCFVFYPIFGITENNDIFIFIPNHPNKEKKIITLNEFVDIYSKDYEEMFTD